MKNSKKILTVLMAVSMAGALAGCSGDSEKAAPVETKKPVVHESKHEAKAEIPKENAKLEIGKDLIELPDGQYQLKPTIVDGVKEFRLIAMPTQWEVKDGVKKDAWTYNGVMPGPQIRFTEGDKVRIIVENKLTEDTTMHLHGVLVPNSMDGVAGVTQDAIKPGEKFSYEFTATNTGTHMYHSHLNTVQQVDKGLFGTVVIDPKQPTEDEKFDKEFSMMLSDGSMGYLINGKSFPSTKPWGVKKGDKVRVRIMNVGNQIHPMHIHGHDFTVIAKDGNNLPQAVQTKENTINLMPGNTYDVVFTAVEGKWLFHCHVLPHAHEGHEDSGMIQVIAAE